MGELGFSVKLGGKELKPINAIITSAVWNTIDREKLFKSEFFGSFFSRNHLSNVEVLRLKQIHPFFDRLKHRISVYT